MAHVEQPLEVHRADLADRTVGQQPADLLVQRVVAVVEGDRHPPSGSPYRVEDPLAARCVGGHRLLGDHVAAGLQRGHHVLVVGDVHGGHQHHVDVFLGQHREEVVRVVRRHGPVAQLAEPSVVGVHPSLVDVGERDKLGGVGVVAHQRADEHLGACAGADHGVPCPPARLR
ncbi:hypothetical protein GCM10029963_17130 [Micromonospora andamanensis]